MFRSVEQFLKKTERADPAAEKAAKEHSRQAYQTENVKKSRNTLPQPHGEKLLEHSQRAGRESKRTGVTVQNGDTDIFKFPSIKIAAPKSFEMSVYQQKRKYLNNFPFSAIRAFFHNSLSSLPPSKC